MYIYLIELFFDSDDVRIAQQVITIARDVKEKKMTNCMYIEENETFIFSHVSNSLIPPTEHENLYSIFHLFYLIYSFISLLNKIS